jgi:predicted SnoaL-like aldol condensation-catalyzing enzyme
MSPETNKAIIRRFVTEVLNGGNLNLLDELISPGYVAHDPSNPARGGGIEGAKQFIRGFQGGLSSFEYKVEDMLAEGDEVVYRWTMRAVHSGPFMGIPPTGTRLAITGIDMFRLADGKIVESWVVADALSMLQQLGVIPPMGPPPPA